MEAAVNRELEAGEVVVRPAEYMAAADGRPLNLTSRELELLTALVERKGRIVSREELHRTVWGEPDRRFIHTHFGFGYRLPPEQARSHLTRLS